MKQIIIASPHQFCKLDMNAQNNETLFYDLQCKNCNITGISNEFGKVDIDEVHDEHIINYCSNRNISKVKIVSNALAYTFGLKINEIYDCDECPNEYKKHYSQDVWVFSEKLNKHVRCLKNEYILVN
jgi:hypothetical protein